MSWAQVPAGAFACGRVDFVMQSKLALKRKVEGGAGHDSGLSARACHRGSVRHLGELRRYRQDRNRCGPARRRGRRGICRSPDAAAGSATQARRGSPQPDGRYLGMLDHGVPDLRAHLREARRAGAPASRCAREPRRACHDRLRSRHLRGHPDRGPGSGQAGRPCERRHRRRGRADDLRVAVRPHRHVEDLSGASSGSGTVPGALLRTLVPGRAHHACAAGVVADGPGIPGRLLLVRSDARDLRGLGADRIRLSLRADPVHAERDVKNHRVRGGAQPVPLPSPAIRPVRSGSAPIAAKVRRWQP